MDFKIFIDALLTGTPIAVLAAAVGVIWQLIYTRSRDRLHDAQIQRELALAERKFAHEKTLAQQRFEHQEQLEKAKFGYERRQWREQLAHDITLVLFQARIDASIEIWNNVVEITKHQHQSGNVTAETTQQLAQKVQRWRYGKGGLLSEDTTRDVAYAFQRALWEYDGSKESYKRIRVARRLFRNALRADLGLGEDIKGRTIYQSAGIKQRIEEELTPLLKSLDQN